MMNKKFKKDSQKWIKLVHKSFNKKKRKNMKLNKNNGWNKFNFQKISLWVIGCMNLVIKKIGWEKEKDKEITID